MGSFREKGVQLPVKSAQKIAAPKPVRARPITLNHLGNSKWLQTSPVKNENTVDESEEDGNESDSKCEHSSEKMSGFFEPRRINF